MKIMPNNTRREFLEGALFTGAAFAFTNFARAEDNGGSGDSGTSLITEKIPQPEGPFCFHVSFSRVNDQAAFVSGTYDNMSMYVSRPGQPDKFDTVWQPNTSIAAIKGCSWSPDGKEIAFLVQAVNEKTTPKSGRISVFVADVGSRAVREPVVISESIGKERNQLVNVSYKKELFWWDDSCICVPADKAQGGGVLKFDKNTGKSEPLSISENGKGISTIARTNSGKMRFVKYSNDEAATDKPILLFDLSQDGTTQQQANLTEQFGQILRAQITHEGDFIIIQKGDLWSPRKNINLIYEIETKKVVGQIPHYVSHGKDIYSYLPVTVKNKNELILIEIIRMAADGSDSEKNTQINAVKMLL